MDTPSGQYVSGYLASDDLSTAAAVPLFDANGVAFTPAVGDRLLIHMVVLNNGGTARKITLFADADGDGALDSGEELYAATIAANSANSPSLYTPIFSRKIAASNVNRLMAIASGASAGTVIVINGEIIKS